MKVCWLVALIWEYLLLLFLVEVLKSVCLHLRSRDLVAVLRRLLKRACWKIQGGKTLGSEREVVTGRSWRFCAVRENRNGSGSET